MFTTIKIACAAVLGFAVLSPGFTPRADDCQCKAKANAFRFVPRANDCECKAKANTFSLVPHADDCECKAKAK